MSVLASYPHAILSLRVSNALGWTKFLLSIFKCLYILLLYHSLTSTSQHTSSLLFSLPLFLSANFVVQDWVQSLSSQDHRPLDVFTEPRVASRGLLLSWRNDSDKGWWKQKTKALPISAPWFPQKWEERVNWLLPHMSPRTATRP